MKNMKKLVSLLLAVCLMASLAIGASAAEPTTVDVSVEDSQERADSRCAGTLVDAMRDTVVGYDGCFVENQDIKLKRGKVHYALLPVWMLHTKWKGKDYLFSMNGQTGKLTGDLPVSWGRFWAYFAGIAGGLAAVLAVLLFAL